MREWSRSALRVLHRFEQFVDHQWRRRVGRPVPEHIVAYRGYGRTDVLRLTGRVLAGKPVEPAAASDSSFDNLRAMYRRFTSREVPGVLVRTRFGEAVQEVETNEEGYFEAALRPAMPPNGRRWHEVDLTVIDHATGQPTGTRATGQVLVPPPESAFGVISDVDDTVIQTGAANFKNMLRTTMFGNARTRLPFKGVAAFYRALQRGTTDAAHNPIFYVSSSPWNLYDFLADFMDVQGIPAGPIFLRDLGLDDDKFIKTSHRLHKVGCIERLLRMYPERPFLLIGDSGQKDPEIYRQIMQDFPGRIRAVYIRDVADEARRTEVQALALEVQAQHAELLLVADTEVAAVHAAERGFIDPGALGAIRAEKKADEK